MRNLWCQLCHLLNYLKTEFEWVFIYTIAYDQCTENTVGPTKYYMPIMLIIIPCSVKLSWSTWGGTFNSKNYKQCYKKVIEKCLKIWINVLGHRVDILRTKVSQAKFVPELIWIERSILFNIWYSKSLCFIGNKRNRLTFDQIHQGYLMVFGSFLTLVLSSSESWANVFGNIC